MAVSLVALILLPVGRGGGCREAGVDVCVGEWVEVGEQDETLMWAWTVGYEQCCGVAWALLLTPPSFAPSDSQSASH